MSRKTRKVLTWIMTIIIIVIALFNLPYQRLKNQPIHFSTIYLTFQ